MAPSAGASEKSVHLMPVDLFGIWPVSTDSKHNTQLQQNHGAECIASHSVTRKVRKSKKKKEKKRGTDDCEERKRANLVKCKSSPCYQSKRLMDNENKKKE